MKNREIVSVYKLFIFVCIVITIFQSCKREVIEVEPQSKPARVSQNKFIGTWVQCAKVKYGEGECICDTGFLNPDTIVYTQDSIYLISQYPIQCNYEYTKKHFVFFNREGGHFESFPKVVTYSFRNNDNELIIRADTSFGIPGLTQPTSNRNICFRRISD